MEGVCKTKEEEEEAVSPSLSLICARLFLQMLSCLEHMYHDLGLVKDFNINPITLKRWLVRAPINETSFQPVDRFICSPMWHVYSRARKRMRGRRKCFVQALTRRLKRSTLIIKCRLYPASLSQHFYISWCNRNLPPLISPRRLWRSSMWTHAGCLSLSAALYSRQLQEQSLPQLPSLFLCHSDDVQHDLPVQPAGKHLDTPDHRFQADTHSAGLYIDPVLLTRLWKVIMLKRLNVVTFNSQLIDQKHIRPGQETQRSSRTLTGVFILQPL